MGCYEGRSWVSLGGVGHVELSEGFFVLTGIFVGYFESLKAYRIYFPRFKKIDIGRDVTFDKDSAYKKSRKRPAEEPEETEAPKIHDTTMNEENQEEDREIEEP